MCLVVNSPIQIAKRGILVWKVVKPIQNNEVPQWSPTIIEGTGAYKFNEILKARGINNEKLIEIENLRIVPRGKHGDLDENEPVIREGFHSFTTKNIHLRLTKTTRKKIAIIPKGSQYAKGTKDDIVSSHIIVFSNTWELIRYYLYGHK